MKRWEVFGVLIIVLYMAITWQSTAAITVNLPNKTQAPQVLAAATYQLHDSPNLPSKIALLDKINAERANQSHAKVVANEQLTIQAQARADDMSRKRYYRHQDLLGQYFYDSWQGTALENHAGCENLVLASSVAAEKFIQQWRDSPAHNACMLDTNLYQVGIGFAPVLDASGNTTDTFIAVAILAQ